MNKTRTGRARFVVAWGLLDQVVASGSTFVFVVIAASSLAAPEVGAVAFAFELYLLSVFAARGVCGDPLTTRFAGTGRQELLRPIRSAATVAVGVGTIVGAAVAVTALVTDPPLRDVLLVTAACLPGLTLQDYVRSALIVQGRVRATFVNDACWAVGQLPVLALVAAAAPSGPAVMAAWGGAGCAAAILGLVQLRAGLDSPRSIPRWLRETRDLWPYYLTDNLIYQLAALALILVISATAGLAATAGVRVALTVYAPLALIGRGVISVAVAMLARRRDEPVVVRQRATFISLALTPLALAWGFLLLLVPTHVGATFFGESWHQAEPLVFLASFVCASGLFAAGMVIGLRALGAGRQGLAARLTVSVGAAAAAAVGGLWGEERGVFVALACFLPIQMLIWWRLLGHATEQAVRRISSGDRLDVE